MKDQRALRANLSAFLFAVLAAIVLVLAAAAQEKVVNVKTVPVTYTNPAPAVKCIVSTARSATVQQAKGMVLLPPH